MQSAYFCSSKDACQISHAFEASFYVGTQLSLLGLYLTGDSSDSYPFLSSQPGIGTLIYLECDGKRRNTSISINNAGEQAHPHNNSRETGGQA